MDRWPEGTAAGVRGGRASRRPFPDDKPLFTITADNVDEHADKLSPGQIAMFKRYPDTYRMRIFPTRRSARHPEAEYEATKIAAQQVELAEGGNGLVNMYSGGAAVFPIPQAGVEVIWNHVTRFRNAQGLKRRYTQIPVQANGSFAPVLFEDESIPSVRVANERVPESPVRVPAARAGAGTSRGRRAAGAREHRPGARAAQGLGLQRGPAPRAPGAEHRLRRSGHGLGRPAHRR
jgi:hypothetical protein